MLEEVNQALGAALTLDPSALAEISVTGAVGVAVLASISAMLGHSAVLLLNRIRGLRLLTTLLVNGLMLASLRVLQVAMTWGVAALVLRERVSLASILTVGLVSLAPQVFAVVTAAPHIGLFIGRLLEAWGFLVLVAGVNAYFGLGVISAVGVGLAGWAAMHLVSRLLRGPVSWAGARILTLATGRPHLVTARDILAGTPVMPLEAGRSAS